MQICALGMSQVSVERMHSVYLTLMLLVADFAKRKK